MTRPAAAVRPAGPWIVAGLGWAYYMTPLLVVPAIGLSVDAWPLVRVALPGLLAIGALRWRATRPIATAIACAAFWAVSPTVVGAAAVAQDTVARRTAGIRPTLGTGAALLAGKGIELIVTARAGVHVTAIQFELFLAVLAVVVASLMGLLARARVEARADRVSAEVARHEAELARLAQARLAERERIAREMHDVIAHRLSLVAMHAGVLAYRTSMTPEEYRETAGLIQTNAQASLDELRAMLTTLRNPQAQAAPEPPQPTLEQVRVLVADAADAGQHVHLSVTGDLATVPVRVSRHGFRIIQEALTNARKHAPGAPVEAAVVHADDAVHIRVTNPLADLAPPDRSGAGLGLIGVDERATLLGGRASHGVGDGAFVLDVTLPVRNPGEQR